MIARYPGRCSAGGDPIAVGEEITSYGRGWAHPRCVPEGEESSTVLHRQRIDRAGRRPGEVACLQCFLIHPEGACDL